MMSKLGLRPPASADASANASADARSTRSEPPPFELPYTRRSAAAAEAAARWEALERETEELRKNLLAANASIEVLTRTSDTLRAEVASLRFDNERLLRENVAIQTRVNVAAETLLGIREIGLRPPSPEVEEAIENALSDGVSETNEPPATTESKSTTGEWK